MKVNWVYYGMIIIFMLIAVLVCSLVMASEAPNNLWKGILAEAVSEGYEGMYAVACVYKNRIEKGMSLGCAGLNRKDLNGWIDWNTSHHNQKQALEIINQVFYLNAKDITLGATHYENIEAFGVPYWAEDMVVTTKIGNHTFYKET